MTGVYQPIPFEEADRPVTVLSVDSLSLLSNTFADFLRLDPSLDLRQRAPNLVQSDLSIRGASFGQTLVLLDGLRLNDVQSGHHNLDIPVPLEAVERIEVLRGSGSTLYGSDAIGGVVNFITKKQSASEMRLRGAGGNFGVNQQRVVTAYSSGNFSQQLAASRDFSSGFMPNRDYRNLSLSSATRLKWSPGWSSIVLGHTDRPFGADKFYGNFNSWERTRGWFASARQEIGSRTEASFAFRRHTDLFVLYRDRPQVFTNRHAVESWQLALRRRDDVRPALAVFYGAEALHDNVASTNLGYHSRARGALYGALEARALRRFSLTAAAREEIYSSADTVFAPTVSGAAWVNAHMKLRASVSRAFRLPTFTDLYYHDPGNRGSPDLRPERAVSYDGGADVYLGRIRASATVFQRRERDGIDYVRSTPADIWRATNIQNLRFTGFESLLSFRLPTTHVVDLSYTFLDGVQQSLRGLLSKYAFNYARHSGIVSWTGELAPGWSGRVRIGMLERLGRDPYTLVDLYAARTAGAVRPFLQLTNLTDTAYQEIFGVPMPGRAVVAGCEFQVLGRR